MGMLKKDLLARKAKEIKKLGRGRPREYFPEVIAEELLEWADKDDSISLVAFAAEKGYTSETIWRMANESVVFSDAYQITKMKLAARREILASCDQLNYGSFMRTLAFYDPFLNSFEEKVKDKDAERRKGIAESEQMNLVALTRMVSEGKVKQKK